MASGGVWVLVQHADGRLLDGSLEVVGEASKLADKTGQEMAAVLLGDLSEDQMQLLAQHGAAQVILIDHASLRDGSLETDAQLLAAVIKQQAPDIVVAAHSIDGADLAGRIAARLGTGLVTACERLDVADDNRLAASKPVYGSKASATFVCPGGKPQMATVNPDAIDLKTADSNATAEVIRLSPDVTIEGAVSRVVDFLAGDPRLIPLTEAEIVVAGGMGLESKANWRLVEELADVIGGSVGATRRAVDEEWVASQRQVGLTGKTVRPRLYIACGISGAIQHTMGMKDARMIMAINTDRNAPIFKMADVAVVGDVLQVLPVLTARLREALADTEKLGADEVLGALGKA